jgi:CBS domain-containing protein
MHASDVVEVLPTARLDDAVLPAVRMVTDQSLPGLIVVDDAGQVVTCISSVDLLRLALPRYLGDDPYLARVFDEHHADRVAACLVGIAVRDVVGQTEGRTPVVRPDATVVEIADLMVKEASPLVMVKRENGETLGIVTANRLLEALANAAEDAPR